MSHVRLEQSEAWEEAENRERKNDLGSECTSWPPRVGSWASEEEVKTCREMLLGQSERKTPAAWREAETTAKEGDPGLQIQAEDAPVMPPERGTQELLEWSTS